MYIDRGTSDTSYSRALSYMISTMGTHQTNNLNGIWRVSIDNNCWAKSTSGYTFSHRVFDGIPSDKGKGSTRGSAPKTAVTVSRSLFRKVSDDSEDEQVGWAARLPQSSWAVPLTVPDAPPGVWTDCSLTLVLPADCAVEHLDRASCGH